MAQSSLVFQWFFDQRWFMSLLNPITLSLLQYRPVSVLLPVDLFANKKGKKFDFLEKIHPIVPPVVVVCLGGVGFGFGSGGGGAGLPLLSPRQWVKRPIIIPSLPGTCRCCGSCTGSSAWTWGSRG